MAETNLYVVVGATGNIGHRLTEILLQNKQKVRAVARHKEKLEPLVKKGAEAFVASVEDAAQMTKAFSGAKAVFTMIPPNYAAKDMRAYQNKVSEAFAAAIKNSGLKYVVNLSSVGAHMSEKAGPVNGLHDNDNRLDQLTDVNILHLRPAFFMENLLMNVDLIRSKGIVGSPLKGDTSTPMIATRDIAAAAAEHLLKLDFKGKSVQELHGQRDLTMNEVTKVLSKAVNRAEVTYVQFPYADAKNAMMQMGLSEDVARLLIEMQRSMNEGVMKPVEKRGAANTTPTSIEQFAQIFAAAYSAKS